MPYDRATGTENSFLYIPNAETFHGRKHITQLNVPQGGIAKGRLVTHRQDWAKRQVYYNPTKTPGLSWSIRSAEGGNPTPSQTERARDVHGLTQIPYSAHLRHGH